MLRVRRSNDRRPAEPVPIMRILDGSGTVDGAGLSVTVQAPATLLLADLLLLVPPGNDAESPCKGVYGANSFERSRPPMPAEVIGASINIFHSVMAPLPSV